MQTPYVEKDCVFEHEGRKFESGGAVVTDDYIVAYLGKANAPGVFDLTDWHGNVIGAARITATWQRRSYVSTFLHQVHATVNGTEYTGRCAGVEMVYHGRKVKGKR